MTLGMVLTVPLNTVVVGGSGMTLAPMPIQLHPTAKIGASGQNGAPYMRWEGAFSGHSFQALKSLTISLKPLP